MKAKSRITAISINKDIDSILNKIQQKQNKSRSQIVRDLILNINKKPIISTRDSFIPEFRDLNSQNEMLKSFCKLISETGDSPKIFIGIAIAAKNHKIVIGQRSAPDQIVKHLTWTFPSVKLDRLNFESQVLKNLKSETGLSGKTAKLIFARTIPDILKKDVTIIAFYYHIRTLSGTLKKGGSFQKVQWIPAPDTLKYFTTSVSDEIVKFLNTL